MVCSSTFIWRKSVRRRSTSGETIRSASATACAKASWWPVSPSSSGAMSGSGSQLVTGPGAVSGAPWRSALRTTAVSSRSRPESSAALAAERSKSTPVSVAAASISPSATSSSSRVWEAAMQKRERERSSGVAGKPTTTTAIARLRQLREKLQIFSGWYSMIGMMGESMSPRTRQPIASRPLRNMLEFSRN
eukprot:scaffold4440_cov109-Isochrysis_galbana.AAC.5